MPQAGSEVQAEVVPFEVIDQDVGGLLLKTFKGLSITGTVVIDGVADKSILAKLAELRLRAYVRNENGNSGTSQESPLNFDGTFRIGGLSPGTAHFYLTGRARRPPANFTILRVEQAGVVQPRGIEIKAGENIAGVRITLSYGSGSIRGVVKLVNGPLPQGANLSVSIKKLEDTTSNYRPYNVDARGHFLIEGVSAGSYELYVTVYVSARRIPQVKQLISVSDGAATDVDVTLDLRSNPQP